MTNVNLIFPQHIEMHIEIISWITIGC